MNVIAMQDDERVLREEEAKLRRIVAEQHIVNCDRCSQPATMRISCTPLRVATFRCESHGDPIIAGFQEQALPFSIVRVNGGEAGWLAI